MDTRAYETYMSWKSWSSEEFGSFSSGDAAYFQQELRAAGILQLRGCRVLELGFGNGHFAAWSMAQGAIWTGIEMIPELVASARGKKWDAHAAVGTHDVPEGLACFDLIVAYDVLEHLPTGGAVELLSRLRPLLADAGRVVARIPSGDSPFARAIQYGDVTHATPIGSSAVVQIAQSAGLEVLQIREPVFPIWGSGLVAACRRLLVAGLRRALFPLIRLVFMGTRRAILTPNMVFVLGVRR